MVRKSLVLVRAVAMGAARSKARVMGIDLTTCTAQDMLAILDDMSREQNNKQLQAVQWYKEATPNQINMFCREWNEWLREQRDMLESHHVKNTEYERKIKEELNVEQ